MKVDDVVLDFQTGKLGIQQKNAEGCQVVSLGGTGKEGKARLETTPLTDFSVKIPSFALRTAPENLSFGDIVVIPDGGYAFFHTKKVDDKVDNPVFSIINAKTGRTSDITSAYNRLLGNSGVLAVKSMDLTGGSTGDTQFPWWMLLLKDDGDKSSKMMMLMMMLQQQKTGGNTQFPWWLLLLNDEDEDGGKMMKMMMLMQMVQGGSGNLSPLVFSELFNDGSTSGGKKK